MLLLFIYWTYSTPAFQESETNHQSSLDRCKASLSPLSNLLHTNHSLRHLGYLAIQMSPYSLALTRPGAVVAVTAASKKSRRKGARTRKPGLLCLGAKPGSANAAAEEAHR